MIRDYKVVKHLDDGTFGRVLEVTKNRRSFAMKIVVPKWIQQTKLEVNYLRKAKSKWIVRMYESFYEG